MRKILAVLLIFCFFAAAAYADGMPTVADVPRRSVRIRALGDIMMHTLQLEQAARDDGTYDFSPQFTFISQSMADADYTMANLETTVGLYSDKPYSGYPKFNAPESLLQAVKDAGVDFLTLANNHMLDRYFDGMVTTVNNVEKYGFDFSGAYRTRDESEMPKIVEVNGIKIGVMCYTENTNTLELYCDPAAAEYGFHYLYKSDYAADAQALRDMGAEFIIAMPHWGTEYKRKPDPAVRQAAKDMIAAGVSVVLGSHPHMVQPIEYVTVDTPQGEKTGLVAWSLGNFIDDMKVRYTDSGIILDFTVTENADGGFTVSNAGYVPLYVWRQDAVNQTLPSALYLDYQPEGMSDKTWARLKESYYELVDLIGDEFPVLEK